MVGYLKRVDPAEAPRLGQDPGRVLALTDDAADTAEHISLDTLWHGVHYGLTGHGDLNDLSPRGPLGDAVMGLSGAPLGNEGDWGYGRPRLLDVAQVAAVHRALEAFDDATFEQRFFEPSFPTGTTRFAGVYRYEGATPEDIEDGWDFLEDLLADLRDFYEEAAEEGQVVIAYLG
jgi:hypothetical protein